MLKNYFSREQQVDSVFSKAFPLTFVEHLMKVKIFKFRAEKHELKLVRVFFEEWNIFKEDVSHWRGLEVCCRRL